MDLNWTDIKIAIGADTGLPDSVLHLNAGMLILVLAAVAMRRVPWSLGPWLTVLVAETLNETYDLLQTKYKTDEGNFAASWHDMWMTMLWPTVILLVFPWLLRRWASSAGSADGFEQSLE
jgi:hypothetical protein